VPVHCLTNENKGSSTVLWDVTLCSLGNIHVSGKPFASIIKTEYIRRVKYMPNVYSFMTFDNIIMF
jgi:hypothetical protein